MTSNALVRRLPQRWIPLVRVPQPLGKSILCLSQQWRMSRRPQSSEATGWYYAPSSSQEPQAQRIDLRTLEDWRNALAGDNYRRRYESDLDTIATRERRLVTLPGYREDPELWQELFNLRRQYHGDDGVGVIWKHLRLMEPFVTPPIWQTNKLWPALVDSALKDEEMLEQLVSWMEERYSAIRPARVSLYARVLAHNLERGISAAKLWHERLKDWASRGAIIELVKTVRSIKARDTYQDICTELPSFRAMYGHLVPALCSSKRYEDALSWHDFLLELKDLPENMAVVDPLLTHLRQTGQDKLAFNLVRQLGEAGVQELAVEEIEGERVFAGGAVTSASELKLTTHALREADPHDLRISIPDSAEPDAVSESILQEALISAKDQAEARAEVPDGSESALPSLYYNMKPRQLSDKFIAKLFATKFFALQTIVNGLGAIHVDEIGPLALREAIARGTTDSVATLGNVRRVLEMLKEAEISIGQSTFSKLVSRSAVDGRARLLQDALSSDQHPEALEDRDLQQRLLIEYLEAGNEHQIAHTMAILEIDSQDRPHTNTDVKRLQLRHAIDRKDRQAAIGIMQEMLARKQALGHDLQHEMSRKILLSPRQPGHRPESFRELLSVISIQQRFMRSGFGVALPIWKELIKRTAWSHKIEQFEDLAMWLAKWYLDLSFREAQMIPERRGSDRLRADFARTGHFASELFNKQFQQTVIATGFRTAYFIHPQQVRGLDVLQGSHEEKVQILARDRCLWGIHMLVKLRGVGVTFEAEDIRTACRVRLIALFGRHLSQSVEARAVQFARKAEMVDYAAAMERVWGRSIFADPESGVEGLKIACRSMLTGAAIRAEKTLGKPYLRSRIEDPRLLSRTRLSNPSTSPTNKGRRMKRHHRTATQPLPPADTDQIDFKAVIEQWNVRRKAMEETIQKGLFQLG